MKVTFFLYWMIAMTAEIRMNTAMKILIIGRFLFSSFLLPMKTGSMKSSVRVELDASTSDDRVDIDAERTSTRAIPKITGERFASIAGIMAS